jgi:outer membrane autotransporter protein
LGQSWRIESQAQIIYQTLSVNGSRDAYSTAAWRENDAVTARFGGRPQYTAHDGERLWQPYLKANLWRSFDGADLISLGASPAIENQFGNSALEFTARLTRAANLHGHVDHR